MLGWIARMWADVTETYCEQGYCDQVDAPEEPKPIEAVISCGPGVFPAEVPTGIMPSECVVIPSRHLTGEEDLPVNGPGGTVWCSGQVEGMLGGERLKVSDEILNSPAYPSPKFTRRKPNFGDYFWHEDGCLVEVPRSEFGYKGVAESYGEQWVLETDVWFGATGYSRSLDWVTVLPKCTENWPDGEKLIKETFDKPKPKNVRKSPQRTNKKQPKRKVTAKRKKS